MAPYLVEKYLQALTTGAHSGKLKGEGGERKVHWSQAKILNENWRCDPILPVSDFSEIKMEILKHGDAVEVIKPKELRDSIKAEAEKIAKIY